MKGGGKIIPRYIAPKNDPYVSNQEKAIKAERFVERKRDFERKIQSIPKQQPMVDLQVYQPSKPKGKRPNSDVALYAPVSTQNPYMPPSYMPYSICEH